MVTRASPLSLSFGQSKFFFLVSVDVLYLDPYLVILLDLDQDPHQNLVDLDQFTFKPKVKQNHTFPESFINGTVQRN
jgi:hypothetical protein